MDLVSGGTKAKLSPLSNCLPLPEDTRCDTFQCRTGAPGVHLTQVNRDPIDCHQELVLRGPVINLVQQELHPDFFGPNRAVAGTLGEEDGLGDLLPASSKPTKELSEAIRDCCLP